MKSIIVDCNYPGVVYVCDHEIADEVMDFMRAEGGAVGFFNRIPKGYEVVKVVGVSMTPEHWGLITEE